MNVKPSPLAWRQSALLLVLCMSLLLRAKPVLAAEETSTAKHKEYDVLIYGGTAGGIVAAISAAREGASVIVLEPTRHLGGMVTGGLGRTDTGRAYTIGGIADEFYRRMNEYYAGPDAWKWQTREEFLRAPHDRVKIADGRWCILEPSAAANMLQQMLDEAKVEVLRDHRAAGVSKNGARLNSIRCANGTVFAARVFIDTTYEGHLMELAGVSNRYDREPRSEYGETVAGVVAATDPAVGKGKKERFGPTVDPYVNAGEPASGLLPGIQKGPRGNVGDGDQKVQAYNFRICLTDHPDNRVAITRPPGYDPNRYELLARWIATQPDLKLASTAGEGGLLRIDPIPNRKTDINDGGVFSTDYIGANWDYPAGDFATRQRIIQEHIDYTKGLLYFAGHDPRVPQSIRDEMQTYGYAKDEYVDNEHWSPQLYIREARRMVGRYVMTEHDAAKHRSKEDSIGMGSYGRDSHHVQRVVHDGQVINEGNFWVGPAVPYEIPYRAITPRQEECDNLLVTFCVSASHVAFSSIRMEPVFMITSESAAVAAVMAARGDVAVQDVDVPALQKRLIERKQIIKRKQIAAGG